MTLQDVKAAVAGYHYGAMYQWDELFPDIQLRLFDEVAELYARSKWDEACEAQKAIIAEEGLLALMKAKPEFKP